MPPNPLPPRCGSEGGRSPDPSSVTLARQGPAQGGACTVNVHCPGCSSGSSGVTSVSQRPVRRLKGVTHRPSSTPHRARSACWVRPRVPAPVSEAQGVMSQVWQAEGEPPGAPSQHMYSCTTWSHWGQSLSLVPSHPSSMSRDARVRLRRVGAPGSATVALLPCSPSRLALSKMGSTTAALSCSSCTASCRSARYAWYCACQARCISVGTRAQPVSISRPDASVPPNAAGTCSVRYSAARVPCAASASWTRSLRARPST
mmetsp:Transcript_31378/g.80072  ORF Transcript_31378/g.80072 Transcript_31378/m.80072 type:complete len:259 (-) Transcript_31378:514-1290(-)